MDDEGRLAPLDYATPLPTPPHWIWRVGRIALICGAIVVAIWLLGCFILVHFLHALDDP
jgi:hypothetical protein